MKTLVIDTSVIVKWINTHKEKDTEKADKILNEVKNGQVELLAPELAKYELGNVLLKGKQLIPSEAYISLGTVYSLPITFVAESEEMSKDTYHLAFNNGITYYDASFMSLAKQYNATLITDNVKHQGKSGNITVKPLSEY
ncbi:MAG: type II toxin-antitoxin system VapC family toxin [Patescibacteria group bacterium]|nr:type II toxin-antitoxin system VapC family toxin [Patescibacteria group bacterium]